MTVFTANIITVDEANVVEYPYKTRLLTDSTNTNDVLII